MKIIGLGFGIAFGFLLSGAGLMNYNVIHEGLLLNNATMFLIMGSAVAVAAAGVGLLEWVQWTTPLQGSLQVKRVSIGKKHVYGAVIFGIGWAITGTCPAVSAAMLGSGIGYGAVVMAGIAIGVLIYDKQRRKRIGHTSPDTGADWSLSGVTTAIFDVDNTLAKCSVVEFYFFIERKQKQGLRRGLFLLSLVAQAPYYIALYILSREKFIRRFVEKKLEVFRYEELDAYAEQFFQEELRHRLIASSCELLMQAKTKQLRVVLLSTNFDLLVKRFGAHFDVPYVCHRVIRRGEEAIFDCSELSSFKARHIHTFPKESIGVGDSRYDIPVLNHVKYPFVVAAGPKRWFAALHQSPRLLHPAVSPVRSIQAIMMNES
jgi:phosphoserine phosphatase